MKKFITGTRQSATQTLLSKIQKRAKSLARNGASYQSELERLSVEMGYAGGWTELQREIAVSTKDTGPNNVGAECNSKDSPPLKLIPFWHRSESELKNWYLKPFLTRLEPNQDKRVLCLDGRIWNCPSLIAHWDETESEFNVLELAKDRFVFLLVNSDYNVGPHETRPDTWQIHLRWRHTSLMRVGYSESLYSDKNLESVLLRKKLLEKIKQQRITTLDSLFSIKELLRTNFEGN